MYKIYINDNKIELIPSKNISSISVDDNETLLARYNGKPAHLLSFIDMAEKTNRYQNIIIHAMDVDSLIVDFENLFKIVEAAGGLVVNEKNQILFILRRGHWDLPKGKLELNETRREGAKREVIEETGIKSVQVDKKLLVTLHSFRNKKNKRCIKLTHWYLMFGQKQKLTPQIEEDIEKTKWMTIEQFQSVQRPVYKSILDVLNEVKTARK